MTVRNLIYRAYRMLGAYGSGEVPTDDDADIALEAIQTMLKQFVAGGFFGPLTDVSVSDDYEAGENERVTNITASSVDITLPQTVVDACSGETRAPEDRSVVIVADGNTNIYDASQAGWIEVDDLTLDDAEPLAGFNLAALLAVYIEPQFPGLVASDVVKSNATATRAALRQKKPIRATMPRAVLDTNLTRNGWMR